MATLIPDRLTPLAEEGAIRAFADGWSIALRWDPDAKQLATLVAHTILECGAGFRSLHWWNFGNEKASPSWPGKYCMYRCNEEIDGKLMWFSPPHPQTWFRAFDSAADGAAEHIRFLATDSDGDGHNRYAAAWNKVVAGDADGFVRALKAAGYFTGNVDEYARAVVSIARRIEPACEKILSSQHHGITDEDRARIEQDVAMWMASEVSRLRGDAEAFPLEDT